MNLREIDLLVAEKVMGWIPQREMQGKILYVLQDGTQIAFDWKPTTNIADAWQVVEKLRKDSYGFEIEDGFDKKYQCCFYGSARSYTCEAETATLAICLSALKSMGVDIEEKEH